MFCKKCGKEIEDDSVFCVHCGTTVSVTVQKDENAAGAEENSDGNAEGKDKAPAVSSEKYPMALPKGSVLAGQYIIDKPIGQGGFGITYIAEDHNDGKKVAVKEYYPETLATRQEHTMVIPLNANRNENYKYGMDCFLQEAKTLSNFINNEDIVRVYSYFEENNTAYFVMEYIEGVSLADYIKGKGGKISFDDACHILFPIMDALAAVHDKGIIHRDISPDNIFVTWEGHVKLIDFGAARYSIGDRSMSLDVILKHGFAPKEQYSRHGRQGPYTDIYALAATFYYAITGKRPQDSVDRMDKDLLISPSAVGAGIGMNAEKALLHALEVQPDKRYQKMTDFKQAMVEAIKQDNSPDAAQSNVIEDDEKTFLGEGFAPQSSGMAAGAAYGATAAYPQQNQNMGGPENIGYTQMNVNNAYTQQNMGMSDNIGYTQQNVGMTVNGYTQQNVGMTVNGVTLQNMGMPDNIGYTQQNMGMPDNIGYTQQSIGMTGNGAYPQAKKKSKMGLWLIIGGTFVVVLLVVVGLILWKGGSSDDPDQPDPVASNPTEHARPTREKKPTEPDEEDPSPTPTGTEQTIPDPSSLPEFETAGHLLERSSSSYYYYAVTNKSQVPVAIKGNAVAYDAMGNMLGVDDATISVLGAGETSILNFYFSGTTGIDHVDCQLLPSTDISYYPFIGNIRLEQSVNEDNVVVTATNTGGYRALFMEVYVLFFDADGKVVDAGSHYILDGEGQLANGASRSVEVDCDEPFDHAECYLTGYSDGEPASTENAVSDREFNVQEYKVQGNYGGTRCFLTIESNCDTPVQMNVNMTAYDASGKAVGAGDSQIEILAKGETSIASFRFSSEEVDHVEYSLGCGTKVLYSPVIGDLSVKATKADGKAIVTVKNNGSKAAEFAEVYALFFDANGTLVYADETYVTDDDYQVKPGAELSEEIRCRVEFDHVECYVTARAKKE